MGDSSEDRIRRYLDGQGGTAQVPFHNLMSTWNVGRPTAADCQRIEDALRSAGVVAQPALSGLAPESLVTLRVADTQAPPWESRQGPQAPAGPQWAAQAESGTVPQAAPAAPPAPAAQARVGPTVDDAEDLGAIGLAMGAIAAIVAFVASFLPWVSAFDQSATLWELTEVLDVFLALFAVAVVAATVATFVRPDLLALRILTLALVAGLLSFVLIPPIEFMVSGEGEISGTQAGEIVGLIAALGLVGAVALQILDLRPVPPAVPVGRKAILLLAGLALLCFVGVADALVALLPVDDGVSTWEANEVSDILGTLIDAALVAVAGAAILGLAPPRFVALAFVLGSYTAIGSLVGGIEALAGESDGAAVFVSVFLIAPLAIAGSVLVALASNLLRQGTRTSPAAGIASP